MVLMARRSLIPLLLGLGLSASSCKTHKDFLTPHPPQLFYALMQTSKPNQYGLPVGELRAHYQNYTLHARAGIRADKTKYLEILLYHPLTRSGVFFGDGVEGQLLDGDPDMIIHRDPFIDRPLQTSSFRDCFSGYVEARTWVASALAQQQNNHSQEDSHGGTTPENSMTIDRFLSTTPISPSGK